MKNSTETTVNGVPAGLRAWGMRSWYYLGITLWVLVIFTFLNTISSVFVPLVVALVMAMLFHPLVDKLAARRVTRTFGSLLVLLLIVVVLVGTLWLMWSGLVNQSGEIWVQIENGLKVLSSQGNLSLPADLAEQVKESLPKLASGLTSFFVSSFSGIVALVMGGYSALFMLYYLLSDWHNTVNWIGAHLGVPAELSTSLAADAVSAIQIYFYALTLANFPVAVVVGITMVLLGLPLALPVALVTMITSYIPYLGAILSAAFAALVALGTGNATDAVIIIVVIVILQNILDPIISNKIASDKLEMNPIVSLITTMGGGVLFGALGSILASPIVAALIQARKEIQSYEGGLAPLTETR